MDHPASQNDPKPPPELGQRVAFRCSCGEDLLLPAGGKGRCASCGNVIELAQFDHGHTVSFSSDPASGTSFHLVEGHDRSGESLGHFRLLSRLGAGGMGAVYRALDESLQRLVAVKVIRSAESGGATSDRDVARLLDEAVAQARLNHPNVVTIYYVGRQGEEPFFAMELLPGPTLGELVKRGPLPFPDVIDYARQIVSALGQAARLGLVHGDIKPSNLILAGDRIVKLSDFGLAQTETTSSKVGLSGTITYMAPELAGGAEPTIRSDVYSLGVTLFEMTFGYRPFRIVGETLREQLESRREARVAFPEKWPSSVPAGWRELLSRMMAADPQKRFADYDEVAAAIERHAPVGVTTAGLLNRALALGVDYAGLLVFMIPFLIPGVLAAQVDAGPELPDYLRQFVERFRLLGVLAPVVPLMATWMEWRGWRTPGRYLFQLRVVDGHGLKLQPGKRFIRAIFRYIPLWIGGLSTAALAVGSDLTATLIAPIDEMVLLVDTLPVLFPGRQALHDRLVGSRVVLDTKHEG